LLVGRLFQTRFFWRSHTKFRYSAPTAYGRWDNQLVSYWKLQYFGSHSAVVVGRSAGERRCIAATGGLCARWRMGYVKWVKMEEMVELYWGFGFGDLFGSLHASKRLCLCSRQDRRVWNSEVECGRMTYGGDPLASAGVSRFLGALAGGCLPTCRPPTRRLEFRLCASALPMLRLSHAHHVNHLGVTYTP
jgi:hypothetical protein